MKQEPAINATRIKSPETNTPAASFMATPKDKHQAPILTLEGQLFAEQATVLGLQ
jgi:hypothetical protein